MPNLNKVMLIGRLTRSPELKYTASNTPVAKIGIATNRKWTDKGSGEKREEATFVDCTAFGRTAEVINQYFDKGSHIFIEGRLQFSQWKDKEGNNRSKLDVVVDSFEFMDSGGVSSGDDKRNASGGAPRRQEPQHIPVDEDDIPF